MKRKGSWEVFATEPQKLLPSCFDTLSFLDIPGLLLAVKNSNHFLSSLKTEIKDFFASLEPNSS